MTGREDDEISKKKAEEEGGSKEERGKSSTHTHTPPSRSPFRATLPKLRILHILPLVPPSHLPSSPSILSRMKGASSPSSVYRVSLSSTCTSPSFPAFVSSFACPSSPPHPVSYTPFSTWPSRRIHSRDTPLPPPSLFFLFLSLLSPPFLFRFASSPSVLPLPSLSLGARTDGRGATSRFTSLGDMSFSTLVARVSPSHPTAPLVESQDGTRGLVFADEGRDVADGQSIFSFLFFFENLFYW